MKESPSEKVRPGVALIVLVVAVGLLAIVVSHVKRHALTAPSPAGETIPQPEAVGAEPRPAPLLLDDRMMADVGPPVIPESETPDQDVLVQERVSELSSMNALNNPGMRDTLLSEVTNPDREIRRAALGTLVQTRDKSVISRLRTIAASINNDEARAEILETVQFMSLPSLSELDAAGDTGSVSTNHPANFPRLQTRPNVRVQSAVANPSQANR